MSALGIVCPQDVWTLNQKIKTTYKYRARWKLKLIPLSSACELNPSIFQSLQTLLLCWMSCTAVILASCGTAAWAAVSRARWAPTRSLGAAHGWKLQPKERFPRVPHCCVWSDGCVLFLIRVWRKKKQHRGASRNGGVRVLYIQTGPEEAL